jgi:signal transduction histidine kinase
MRWQVTLKDSSSVNAPFLALMHVLLQPLGYQDLAQAVVNALPGAFAPDTAVLGALVLTLSPESHSIEAFAFTEGPNQAAIARGMAGRPLHQLGGDYRRESNVIERVVMQRRAIGAPHLDDFLSGYIASPLLRRFEEIIGWRGGMAIPLSAQQRSAGVLLFALGKEVTALTDEEGTRMTNVAHVVGLALEQARLYEEERRARRALEQAQEQGQTFLRIVAHDLKTPLTNILGYAQLAQRLRRREMAPVAGTPNDAGDRVHAACDKIVENCRRLQRLVDDLQEAFRLGSGRFGVQRRPVDLVALARVAVDEQRAAAPNRTITLSAPAQPLVGQWDGERVQQLVANLVSNAVKYSPSGGPITVTVQRRGESAQLSVTDTGLGIAKDDLPALFQPYSRRHQQLAIKGTGLGLYIVKGIAEAHGGRVRADSPGEGAGATFTVTLPLQPAD